MVNLLLGGVKHSKGPHIERLISQVCRSPITSADWGRPRTKTIHESAPLTTTPAQTPLYSLSSFACEIDHLGI
jgi:hypothetical protein